MPTAAEVDTVLAAHDDWYDDPHGSPAWRRSVSRRFAGELVAEAGGPGAGTGELVAEAGGPGAEAGGPGSAAPDGGAR